MQPLPAALIAVILVGGAAAGIRLRRRERVLPWLVVGTATSVALAVTVVVREMDPSGAAVFGWSLLWASPMLPYRALGLPLD